MNDLYNVYDLFYPSPLALQKIAAIKVAIELWRKEIRTHCANGTLKELNFEENNLSNVLRSRIPESIHATIVEYIKSIGLSIQQWIKCHSRKRLFELEILYHFDDFVGDFDGSIDYEKTAKKMLLSDKIDPIEKFKIACMYFLEDEISRLWPFVQISKRIDLGDFTFARHPQLFYWICRLKNELYMIPDENFSENVYRNLFGHFIRLGLNKKDYYRILYWPSIKFILKRLDSGEQMNCIIERFCSYPQEFYRYVLAKLNRCEFDELLAKNRNILWNYACSRNDFSFNRDEKFMAIWIYVKDEMNENDFSKLIQEVSSIKPISGSATDEPSIGCRIYSTAPENFKQSAITQVFLNNHPIRDRDSVISCLNDVSLLLTALSDASDHERKEILKKYWSEMMIEKNIDEFDQFVTSCLKDEKEMNHFRETYLSNYEKIHPHFSRLFKNVQFEKLNVLIRYCFAEEQKQRDFRIRLLDDDFILNDNVMKEPRALNEFINDNFNDADGAAEFKNQLFSKPLVVESLEKIVKVAYNLREVKEFIEILIPRQFMTNFKKNFILPFFKPRFLFCFSGLEYSKDNLDYFVKFLRWCLENDDGNVESSQAIPIDEIVQAVLRRELWIKSNLNKYIFYTSSNSRTSMTYCPDIVEFLKWYLVTNEDYENIKEKYANNDAFVKLTKLNDEDV